MLYSDVVQIIKELALFESPCSFDKIFIADVKMRMESNALHNLVSQQDIEWLVASMASRWTVVRDTELDYTLGNSDQNKPWIALATQLADRSGNHFIQILLPTLKEESYPSKVSPKLACVNLQDILVGYDNNTWYHVPYLLTKFNDYSEFYSSKNKKMIKTFSLIELLRVKRKENNSNNDNQLPILRSILKQLTLLSVQGEPPRYFLFLLFEYLNDYLTDYEDQKKGVDFQKKILTWFGMLQSSSRTEDINALCCLSMKGDSEPDYLIVRILDCITTSPEQLVTPALLLAKWFTYYNPALVSKARPAKALRVITQLGEFYSIEELRRDINALLDDKDAVLSRQLIEIKYKLANAITINSDLVHSIKILFASRWSIVKDTTNDYLRYKIANNNPWVWLAECLSTTGLISSNYYNLLIPTLDISDEKDFISATPYIYYPLSEFILSEEDNQLILVSNCISHHRNKGTFLHYSGVNLAPRSLTKIEIDRLESSHPRLFSYYKRKVMNPQALAISRSTVEALIDLVNNSTHKIGLVEGVLYDDALLTRAERAWGVFQAFYLKLSNEERERLNSQRIHLAENECSFKSLYKAAILDEDKCVASIGQFIAKLVFDYDADAPLSTSITRPEIWANMKKNSLHRVYREHEGLTAEEAKKRLLILMLSIMTNSFHFAYFSGIPLYAWDQTNYVVEIAKTIFSAINTLIEFNNFNDACYVYAMIIEKIVKPSIDKPGILTRFMRCDNTTRWCQSILDGSLFTKTSWFELEFLMSSLWPYAKTHLTKQLVPFLDEIIHTSTQDTNNALKSIRVNILFTRFLSTLSDTEQKTLLLYLSQCQADTSSFLASCKDFIAYRMTEIFVRERGVKTGDKFFGNANKEQFRFEITISSLTESMNGLHSVQALKQWLAQTAQMSCSLYTAQKEYLFLLLQSLVPSTEQQLLDTVLGQ